MAKEKLKNNPHHQISMMPWHPHKRSAPSLTQQFMLYPQEQQKSLITHSHQNYAQTLPQRLT